MNMSSLLVIANKALRKIGVDGIESLTQQGQAAAECNAAVKDVLRETLAAHSWGFASVWEKLARLADAPPFGYRYAFQIPPEAIRLVDARASTSLTSPNIKYDVVADGVLYTDSEFCYARYVKYTQDLAFAPADFINAVACKLAAEISVLLAKSEFHAAMLQEYAVTLDRARTGDESTKNHKEINENQSYTFLSVREYEGEVLPGSDTWIPHS